LISGTAECNGSIYEIEYTVTDDCGMSASCIQQFTLVVSPPTIVCPPDETISCLTDLIAGTPTATVSCGLTSTVSSAGSLVSGMAGCDGAVYAITFTVTDECGQTGSCDQMFTLNVDPPTITCPADLTVDCLADVIAGTPVVSAACMQGTTITSTAPTLFSGQAECTGAIYQIEYTVTDDCGATASCIQNFTLNVPPPSLVCPADMTVDCLSDIAIGTPIPTVSCGLTGAITSAGPTLVNGAAECNGSIYEIIYTVTDVCGQTATCTQSFTLIVDPPTIVCPADATVECLSDVVPGVAVGTASCGIGSTVTSSAPTLVSGTPECVGAVYQIIYTVTDDCMQTANCTQLFTLTLTAPTITCPPDETVSCLADVVAGTPTTMVSCGLTSTVSSAGSLVSGTPGCDGAIYAITFTVTDQCGQTGSCEQMFTLDIPPPSITCPADVTVSCLADVVPGVPTGTAACAQGNSFTTAGPILISGTAECSGAVYQIEYIVTDDCSASASCVQNFTLDVAPPTIVCPADETVS